MGLTFSDTPAGMGVIIPTSGPTDWLPDIRIIQAGMGVAISGPTLAKTCARHKGVLPTVSLVAAERVFARILQLGDPSGAYRRALGHFPFPEVAKRILHKYYIEGGKKPSRKFKFVPAFSLQPPAELIELAVAASFVFVWLAKEGHTGKISANDLEKLQMTHLYHQFGAMLAGVDCVTMGAGIPDQIPYVLDAYANRRPASYRVTVEGHPKGFETMTFDPVAFFGNNYPCLRRPKFLPIVTTHNLAEILIVRLAKKRGGDHGIDGFVIEKPIAGGHNARPRGQFEYNEKGEPIYGKRDETDFAEMRKLGIPFWLAGGYASPEGLAQALELGATGVQVGSAFALCEQSGMDPSYRAEIRRLAYRGELEIFTDPDASPTGFPFKVVLLPGTMSEKAVFDARVRVCDLTALRVPYWRPNGTIGTRCPSAPEHDCLRNGISGERMRKAKCMCNGLLSGGGLGNPGEQPIYTMGNIVTPVCQVLMSHENDSYTAEDVILHILSGKS